jgi:hypothetical protein
VGEKARAWAAALDGQAGHRRLADGLAVAAAELGPHMDHDLEVGRDVFQHLTLVVGDFTKTFGPAGRTGAGPCVDDALARQVLGQRLAVAGARRLGARRGRDRRGRVLARLVLSLGFLQVADDQLEQIDLAVELLGGLAEPGPPQRGQLRLQLLDMEGLGVQFMLQRPGEGAQLLGVGWQFSGRQRHGDL